MDIKVLGTGCANCKNTIALIEQVAREKGVDAPAATRPPQPRADAAYAYW